MKRWITRVSACAIAAALAFLLGGAGPATAQEPAPVEAKPFTPEELEQIVAPIALYSDNLLAQVFMASTYPIEIVQAARFVKANPKLKDQALTEELKKYDWDDSVKFMVTAPQVLAMMDEKLDWMQKLGDAFLDQRKETMDAVQRLRAKAQAAGNLKSTPEQTVKTEPAPPAAAPAAGQTTTVVTSPPPAQTIIIEPTKPEVVYVPTYNPTVVYGGWPYPAYPPYYYYPPGYVAGAAITFGVGMAVGAAMWGGCNWGGGDVDVDVNKNTNFNKNVNRESRQTQRTSTGGGGRENFQHNPEHRKGAQYRDSKTQQKFDKAGPAGSQGRQDYRGRGDGGAQSKDQAGRGDAGRGDAGRGDAGRGGASASTSDRSRPGGDSGGGRDMSGADRGGGGFSGTERGGDARASSDRGKSSMSSSKSGGFSGGGGSRASTGGGSRSGGGSRGGGGRGGGRR